MFGKRFWDKVKVYDGPDCVVLCETEIDIRCFMVQHIASFFIRYIIFVLFLFIALVVVFVFCLFWYLSVYNSSHCRNTQNMYTLTSCTLDTIANDFPFTLSQKVLFFFCESMCVCYLRLN